MIYFPPTLILRHRKENLKKCSLRGLEGRPDFRFFTYPQEGLPSLLDGYVLLALDAPVLGKEDKNLGLALIDATWRYAKEMGNKVGTPPGAVLRSLPGTLRTAYPRRQDDCPDPERGLASIEALYAAYSILERETKGLLDLYYWKEKFLLLNNFNIDVK